MVKGAQTGENRFFQHKFVIFNRLLVRGTAFSMGLKSPIMLGYFRELHKNSWENILRTFSEKFRNIHWLHFTNDCCTEWSWSSIRLELKKIERFLVAMHKKIPIHGGFALLLKFPFLLRWKNVLSVSHTLHFRFYPVKVRYSYGDVR